MKYNVVIKDQETRLARCLPMYTPDVTNQYFTDAGVKPWWML